MTPQRPGGVVRDDRGFALLEVLTALVVLSIFFAMFTGAIVTTFTSSSRSQGVANTSQELSLAFQHLDLQVRYVSYVSAPAQVPADENNWYVEMQDSNASPTRCIQLRVSRSAGQLQQRSWPVGGQPGSWQPLASRVVNGGAVGAAAPFVVSRPNATVRSAQLTVNLETAQGSGDSAASSRTQLTFTALNTNLTTPSGGQCTGWRP